MLPRPFRRLVALSAILALCAALAVAGHPPAASATTSNLADAYANKASPGANYGAANPLHVLKETTTTGQVAYLKFNSTTAGTGTLGVYFTTVASGSVELHATATTWTETGLTWNNRPTVGALLDTRPITSGPVVFSVPNVTAGDNAFAVVSSSASASYQAFDSKESKKSNQRPVLTVTGPPTTTEPPTTSTSTSTSTSTTSTSTTSTSTSTTTTSPPTTTEPTTTTSPPTTTTSPPTTTEPPTTTTTTPPPPGGSPPPQGGYLTLQPTGVSGPGGWLDANRSDAQCTSLVHRSTWEPRPDNTKRDNTVVDAAAAHAAFAARPHGSEYDPRWDSWMLQRVDGAFTGTTDEIFQWAACKWGLQDDLVRAVAYRESQWYQYLTYPTGRCLPDYGCTDLFTSATTDSAAYCDGLATAGGYDYQPDFGAGLCPKTFSILSAMAWADPTWGYVWPGYSNGSFPFTRNSTAFAADYYGGYLRGCYEGWSYLGTRTTGDVDGCVGSWYSGGWHDSAGDAYDQRVRDAMATWPWLQGWFPTSRPPCDPAYGCPGPDPLP